MSSKAFGPPCAEWARDVGLLPAGTAPQTDVFVLAELPLPWGPEVGEDPLLRELRDIATARAAGRSVRVQAVVCERAAPERRVVIFSADAAPFSGYARAEGRGRPVDLPGIVADLIDRARPQEPVNRVTDLLVCTHGSRDTCCGSRGTRLWQELTEGLDGIQVWRTSHLGGHRFAPTVLTFPDGCYWAHLDRSLVTALVERRIPAARAVEHLRGCAAFTPAVQVADGAALADRGWTWLDAARFGQERSRSRIELCFETRDGDRGGYDVILEEGRLAQLPECGGDATVPAKLQQELRVAQLKGWS